MESRYIIIIELLNTTNLILFIQDIYLKLKAVYSLCYQSQLYSYYFQILTLSVLSILITAPIGAIAMTVTGQKLLQKSNVVSGDPDNADENEKIELTNDIGYV